METKQGYFNPQMPFPLDLRFYKADVAAILAIPVEARFVGMEIYAYTEDKWYQYKYGTGDVNLVESDRGGSGTSGYSSFYQEIFYIDEINGNDASPGTSIAGAVQTLERAVLLSDTNKVSGFFLLSDITIDALIDKNNIEIRDAADKLSYPIRRITASIETTGNHVVFRDVSFNQASGKNFTHTTGSSGFRDCDFTSLRVNGSGNLSFWNSGGVIRIESALSLSLIGRGISNYNIYNASAFACTLYLYHAKVVLVDSDYGTIHQQEQSIVTRNGNLTLDALYNFGHSYFYVNGDLTVPDPLITNDYGSILDVTGAYLGGQTYSEHPNNPAKVSDLTGGGGSSPEQIVLFSSDLDTVQELVFSGLLNFQSTSPFTSGLAGMSYQVRLEISSTWTDQANLLAVNTWIAANVSGDGLTGTQWRLRCIAEYDTGEYGTEGITLNYVRS